MLFTIFDIVAVLIAHENMVESVDNPADEMIFTFIDIVAVLIVDENMVELVEILLLSCSSLSLILLQC
jgi:hypothetical protein